MYATRANIVELYGQVFLDDLLPIDAEEAFDPDAAISKALEIASAEIDAHLSVRYTLPLSGKPRALTRPAVDIAAYILANSHTRLSEEIEKRYDKAVALMERMAMGKAGLGKDEPKIETSSGGSTSGSEFSTRPRMFGRR